MKTTVEISDDLLSEAKQYAAAHGETFRQFLESSLRNKLENSKAEKPKFKLRDGSFGGDEPMPAMDWPTLRALIYEGHGG